MHERPDDILDSAAAGSVIIRGGAHRLLAYGAGMVLSVAGMIVVTRTLGPARFGVFQSILSIVMIVGAVTDAGLGALGIREYTQRSSESRDQMMATLLGIRVSLTCVGVAAAVLILLIGGGSGDLVVGTVLAGTGLVLTVMQTTVTIPLSVELRNGALSLIDLLRQVLTTAAYVVAALVGAGTVLFAAVPLPVSLVVLGVAMVVVKGSRVPRPSADFGSWRALLVTAGPLAGATAVGVVLTYATQLLTAALADDLVAGQFALAFRIFVVFGSISGLLATVAFPLLVRTAHVDGPRFQYALGRMLDVALVAGVGLGLLLAVGAPMVTGLVGTDFAGAQTAVRIVGLALVFAFVSSPLGFALIGLRLERYLLVANLAALLVATVSVLELVELWGAAGASVAVVAGQATLAASYAVALARSGHRPRLDTGVAMRVLLVGLVAAAASLLPGPSYVAVAAAALAYAGGVLFVRALPAEVWSLLR